jgi:putative endonuclease
LPSEGQHLGNFGERLAAAHLESKGYAIIGRNFRAGALAEIDLIAQLGDLIAFVEVRTRRGGEKGLAASSVNRRKAAQMLKAIDRYLALHPGAHDHPLRMDIVTVELAPDGALREVHHYEDAIRV